MLSRPSVTGVLLVLLIYSLWRVPSADTSECSVTGWTLPGLKVGTAERISPVSVYLIREKNFYRVEDTDRRSSQGLIDAVQRNPDDVVVAHLFYQRVAHGLYDVTSFTNKYELELRPISALTLLPDEASRARTAFIGWLESKDGGNRPGAADILRGTAPQSARPNWPGIINTVLAAAGWLLFVLSLGWVPGALRARRSRRNARALQEGRCPRCGYEVYGLRGGVCPECGRVLA